MEIVITQYSVNLQSLSQEPTSLCFAPHVFTCFSLLCFSKALSLFDPSPYSFSAIPIHQVNTFPTFKIQEIKNKKNPKRTVLDLRILIGHGNGCQSSNRRGDLQRLQWPPSWCRSCFNLRYFTFSLYNYSLSLSLKILIWPLLFLIQMLMNFMDSVIQVLCN